MTPQTFNISDVITWLRFPMIVGIILLHTPIIDRCIGGTVYYPSDNFPVLNVICNHVLKADICEAFVPLFFFISGFLFFYRAVPFTREIYVRKLRSRLHTLMVPYLLWNTAFMCFVALIHWLMPSLLSEKRSFVEMSLPEIAGAYWDLNQGLIPLWFIRDLMIVNLFTPLIYVCLRGRHGIYVVLALAALFLSGHYHYIPGIGMRCAFPYILGAWFSVNEKSFIIRRKQLRVVMMVICLLSLAVETVLYVVNGPTFWQNRLLLIVMLMTIPQMVASGLEAGSLTVRRSWADSSFFAFVFHMFIIYIPVYTLVRILPVNTFVGLSLQLLIPVLVGVACHVIFRWVRGVLPAFGNFIVGKRLPGNNL